MSEQEPSPRDGAQNEPQAARPAPDQATTPLPADAPAAPGQQPAAEQPAATAAEAPAGHPGAAPEAPVTHPAAAPVTRGRVRRFAGHRATQLVAVGLLGLVLGGGIVGAVAANRIDHRSGPGHVRMYDRGDRGQDRGGFDQRGPFGDHGNRGDR
ncbi:hypothetical protein [Lentzea sp. NPDC004782]|uniref:hypothetical protein n=1 Tax=Lentzea sp. NPDC004782 TaxID=3154458 RepID=UPI0033AF6617